MFMIDPVVTGLMLAPIAGPPGLNADHSMKSSNLTSAPLPFVKLRPPRDVIVSVVSPAGLEGYYQALAELPPGPKDITKIKTIMADFGIVLQLPPEVR